LQTAERTGYVWQGKQYEGLVTNYLEVLWGFGGDWVTVDGRVLLDAEPAIEALRFMTSAIGAISPPGVKAYAEEETRNIFQQGRSVYLRNWLYVWALAQSAQSAIKDKVGFVPMVHGAAGSSAATLGGWGFAVSKFSRNIDAAWEFVKFATLPEQLKQLYLQAGRIPARKSLVPGEFAAIVRAARPRPRIPEYSEISDILQRWLSAALDGAVPPEEALKHAASETRAVLGQREP
jgi:multiple sugar transport system substrate-binding protein